MATLPPWLDASPQLYAGVAEGGLRAGIQAGEAQAREREFGQEMAFKQQQAQQESALNAQKLQQEQLNQKIKLASFLSDQKQQQLENALKMDKYQTDKNIAEQEMALKKETLRQQMDWRNTQVKTQQERYQTTADAAARKFQAQQEAMTRIHNGEDPAKVYLDLGAALGESATGMAALWKETQPKPTIPDTGPQVIERDGDRFLVNYDKEGVPRYTQLRGQTGGGDDKMIGHLTNVIKLLQADPLSGRAGTPQNDKLKQYQDALDKLLLKTGPPAATGVSGIRGVVNVRPAPSPEFTEPGDADIGNSPPHDEEGETEAPSPNSGGLMQFGPATYSYPPNMP